MDLIVSKSKRKDKKLKYVIDNKTKPCILVRKAILILQ